MLSSEKISLFLPYLLGIPFLTAILLFILRSKIRLAKGVALVSSISHLVLTLLIAFSAYGPLSERKPEEGMTDYQLELPSSSMPVNTQPQGKKHSLTPVVVPEFVPGDSKNQHRTDWHLFGWDSSFEKFGMRGIHLYFGLDGLNIWLVVLTSVMILPVVLISFDTIRFRSGSFLAWIFLLESLVLGVFLSFDLIVFYLCFELTLIPLFFLIGQWGIGSLRREAARKLFLFTLGGGLFTLLGIISMVHLLQSNPSQSSKKGVTFSIPDLALFMQDQFNEVQSHLEKATNPKLGLSPEDQQIELETYYKLITSWNQKLSALFLILCVGFAVKIPLIPVHSWLPDAYSQAPIGVTVLLSALLAKMGTFGILRIAIPLAPDAVLSTGMPILGTLAAIGIIYGAFCAYGQKNMTKLIAYSSVSHLGFCVLGLLAFNASGLAGGTLHMVNHGLSTGALFLLIGYLSLRYNSVEIREFGGLWNKLPIFTFFMMTIGLASVGLPGLNNFVSEMMMLASLFDARNPFVSGFGFAIVAAIGLFLGAWYLITYFYNILFGPVKEAASAPSLSILANIQPQTNNPSPTNNTTDGKKVSESSSGHLANEPPLQSSTGSRLTESKDLKCREWVIMSFLVGLCLWIGLFPQTLIRPMKADIDRLVKIADQARARAIDAKPLLGK